MKSERRETIDQRDFMNYAENGIGWQRKSALTGAETALVPAAKAPNPAEGFFPVGRYWRAKFRICADQCPKCVFCWIGVLPLSQNSFCSVLHFLLLLFTLKCTSPTPAEEGDWPFLAEEWHGNSRFFPFSTIQTMHKMAKLGPKIGARKWKGRGRGKMVR